MSESYYIGAYWGSRPESLAACTDRLLRTLVEFRACHEWVAHWHRALQDTDPNDAVPPEIPLTRDAVESHLYVLDPFPPSEIGYRFYGWNCPLDDDQYATLSISCGAPMERHGPPNAVVLTLPDPSPDTASLYEPQVLRELLLIVVHAWQPDFAVLMSRELRDEILYPDDTMPESGTPLVGWMTYLRARRLAGLAGEPPGEAMELPGLGRLFVVTGDHRFSVENPGDVEIALALYRYLKEHGALATIPLDQPVD